MTVLDAIYTYPGSGAVEVADAASSSSPTPDKIALMVGGVGRSGTSALTRVLNLLGATLPDQILPPAWGNEKGFWEPRAIVELNDEILRGFGSDWYDGRPLPEDWYRRAVDMGYVDRIIAILEQSYFGAPLIVIKDPRLCRLAPLYFAALDHLCYTPRIILPVRHPSEMVASLHRRDGTDPRIAELVWIRHMLETEAVTRPHRRIWVSYDRLLQDWQGLAAAIADTLDLAWPVAPRAVAPAVAAFLDPGLRHFDGAARPPSYQIGRTAEQLWACVRQQTPDMEVRIRRTFEAVRTVVGDFDRLLTVQTVSDDARINGLTSVVADLNRRLRGLHAAPATIGSLQQRMDRLRARSEALEQAARGLSNADPAKAVAAPSITDALADLQNESRATIDYLETVLQSRCWPLTCLRRWFQDRIGRRA